MKFAGLFFFLAALMAAAIAIALFMRAGVRRRHEGTLLRLRASGGLESEEIGHFGAGKEAMNPLLRWACYWLWRAGADIEPDAVARVLWVVAALVPVTLMIFGWIAGTVVLGLIAAAGYAWLSRQAALRRAKILEQLPSFLESVIRILAAGNTLEESLAAAAREMADPIRTLFLSVGRQVRLGAPVEEVLTEMAEIQKLRDLKVLALAASINRKYGGSLRNILKSLMSAIRARDVAARELRALTAETRFSAWVLAIISVGLTLYIYVQNPGYYATMWADTGGRVALLISMFLQVAGIFVIRHMVQSTEEPL